MNRSAMLLVGLGALVAGCSKTPPVTANVPTSKADTGSSIANPPSLESVPSELKSDAYAYYGLGSSIKKDYDMQVTGVRPSNSTQSVTITLSSIDQGKAKFQETDTGTVLTESTQVMSLEPDGLYIESISPQTLKTPHFLQLPAKLSPGVTWSSHQSVDSNGSTVDETLQFKVVGDQTVKTPAGTFTALDVVGTGKGTLTGQPADLSEESWYVKDYGMVKQVATIVSKGKKTEIIQTLHSK